MDETSGHLITKDFNTLLTFSVCIFACSTLTLYFCCLKVACYPERVSLDDYMGFMPDLTHSEKVHVQFCPKVIVY